MFAVGLDWRGGAPVSRRFRDPYFAAEDGVGERRHVFLAGSGLPARFRPGFRIAELGFGTGLTCLVALEAWRASGQAGRRRYTSFEAFPLSAEAMARALAAWPALAALAEPLIRAWAAGARSLALADLELEVIEGDASAALRRWTGVADAWFLDGFAPSRNPEMWEPALLRAAAERMVPGGALATYGAAGSVRRALAAAGCAAERLPGFGGKRQMTVARRAS
jgi:tRNA U34 5-methylaminomethyl-2-thiouridine-forming methyltransferase MnmC